MHVHYTPLFLLLTASLTIALHTKPRGAFLRFYQKHKKLVEPTAFYRKHQKTVTIGGTIASGVGLGLSLFALEKQHKNNRKDKKNEDGENTQDSTRDWQYMNIRSKLDECLENQLEPKAIALSREDFIKTTNPDSLQKLKEEFASVPLPHDEQGWQLELSQMSPPLKLDNEPALQILNLLVPKIGRLDASSRSLLHLFALEQEMQCVPRSPSAVRMHLTYAADPRSGNDLQLKDSLDMTMNDDMFIIPFASDWYFENWRRLDNYRWRLLQVKVRTSILPHFRALDQLRIHFWYQHDLPERDELEIGLKYDLIGVEGIDETIFFLGGSASASENGRRAEGGTKKFGTCECTSMAKVDQKGAIVECKFIQAELVYKYQWVDGAE